MNLKSIRIALICILSILINAACTPKATPIPVDIIGTTAAQMAMVMLTQTAGAATATPTITLTSVFTDTPLPEPTNSEPPKRPATIEFTGCWTGPGDTYTLISNVEAKKYVNVIGIGSEPGWYVIRNPYFNNPCWIEIADLKVDPNFDFSVFPVMTPGP